MSKSALKAISHCYRDLCSLNTLFITLLHLQKIKPEVQIGNNTEKLVEKFSQIIKKVKFTKFYILTKTSFVLMVFYTCRNYVL